MSHENPESALIDRLVAGQCERIEQLVGAISSAEPVPPLDPADLVPVTIPSDAPESKVREAMEFENDRLRRVRRHRESEAVGPMTAFGPEANARFELSEIDPALPDEMDRTMFTTGDVEQTVAACVEWYRQKQSDAALWIAKGRPPMTPGWKER